MFRRRYLRAHSKKLLVFTASFGGARPPDCAVITRPIFRVLAPHLVEVEHMLIIRDTPGLSTTSRNEAFVSVPGWPSSRPELTILIARELHHLARRQNAGDVTTLGDALLHAGFAMWFELLMSGGTPIGSEKSMPHPTIAAAIEGWEKAPGDGGFQTEQVTNLGYALVRRALLGSFDLQASLTHTPTPAHLHALEAMRREAG